jgi:hypothetical protein
MASKKAGKRRAPKQPIRITGKDASILSFVARNGAPSAEHRSQVEEFLSPQVVKVVFSRSKAGNKTGQKTLTQLRKLAESNRYQVAFDSHSNPRKRVGFSKARISQRPLKLK